MNFFDNHFLFSETYIKDYLKDKSRNRELVEIINERFRLIKDWHNEYATGDYSEYPWSEYIDAVLDVMGFQKKIDNSTRILYTDTINENIEPVAVCYLIDKTENVTSTVKGKYYAFNVVNEARKNNVNWAILTNGNKWRLYNTKNISPYENYLEIDIEDSIKNSKQADEAFSLFYLFFNARTYYVEDGEFIIEKIKDESDAKAEVIEETLRGKAEDILKELCYGLKEDIGKESFTEEERKGIYNDAIILLYRMLFFGYAESRGLLPITKDDPEYTESFSKICEDAKEIHNTGAVLEIKEGFEFWNRLDSQLRIYVDRSYNGGLFHNEDKPVLKEHRIANGRLTKCLAELLYNLDKNGKYNERIEYKDLSVRNLGSIYEGLLEYRLFIAESRMIQKKSKGQVKYLLASDVKLQNSDLKNIIEKGGIYLSQDAVERKETGAYYTPEDIVEYIVDNTVGSKLKELKFELNKDIAKALIRLSYEPIDSQKRIIQRQIDEIIMNFINSRILSLSIIDSAMGSGHFLVNAAYRVANEIVDIVCMNNWDSDEEIFADIKYWKRKVVENCVYGIDINELSVLLARLSLWLISASNDKALSYLDHHLKVGNSIVGTDKAHVEIKDFKFPLFGVTYEEYMRPIVNRYEELSKVGSNTRESVIRQKEIFDEINKELSIARKKYDYYLSNQFTGGINDYVRYLNLLRSHNIWDFQKPEMESLWEFASEKKFFHWELEFPEVFKRGGFDIAIGNPPYVEVSESDYKPCTGSVSSTRNLYAYMIANNLRYLKEDGKLSFIVLMALIASKKMKPLRDILFEASGKVRFMNIDSATYPGRLFKGLMIRLTILTVEKEPETINNLYSTNYLRFFQYERKKLFDDVNYARIKRNYIVDGILPKIGSSIEQNIMDKIVNKSKQNIGKFIDKSDDEEIIYYRNTGAVYYCMAFDTPPYYVVNGAQKVSSTLTSIKTKAKYKSCLLCLFHSSLFYWYWTLYSDCYHFTRNDLNRLPIDLDDLIKLKDDFEKLFFEIKSSLDQYKALVKYKKSFGDLEYYEYRHRNSKDVFDKVDRILADYYGLTEEETKFIINYDIKYRVGDEGKSEDEL